MRELDELKAKKKGEELSLREDKLERDTSELQRAKKNFEEYVKTSEAQIDVYKYCMQSKQQLRIMAFAEVLLFVFVALFVCYHMFKDTKLIEGIKKYVGL